MLKKLPDSDHEVLCPTEQKAPPPARVRLSALSEHVVTYVKTGQGHIAVVFLRNGQPRAFNARCPHMGLDVAFALCADGNVACRGHGYRFSSTTGVLLENPNKTRLKNIRKLSATFDPNAAQNYRLREYSIQIEDGWVWID